MGSWPPTPTGTGGPMGSKIKTVSISEEKVLDGGMIKVAPTRTCLLFAKQVLHLNHNSK